MDFTASVGPRYVVGMESPHSFLKTEFEKRKDRNSNYSLRAFARWLQMSPAQLSLLLAGKRQFTLKTLSQISDRMDLSPADRQDLFRSHLKQKQVQGAEISKMVVPLEQDQFNLVADWYHMAILSLTRVKGASGDPRWIARRLGISFEEAHQAVLRLERLGLLQTKPTFKQLRPPFEVASEAPSAAIRRYHKQNLNLAAEKLETVENHLRNFQSITIPMKPQLVKKMVAEIDEFLARIVSIAQNSNGSEVYNLNVQLFPLTKLSDQKE